MSLLIEGMDMPKNCKDCPCREYGKFSYEPDWCCLNRKNIVNAETISPNCPLSDIPTPHGDLIDRDDLLAYFDRKAKGKSAEEALKLLYTALKAYPTVIGKETNQ